MQIAKTEANLLQSKFRGALLGALLGDCLGAPFEGDCVTAGDRLVIQQYFDGLESSDLKGPFRKYTDDTAMTKSLAKALTYSYPEIDYKYLARSFVRTYYNEPKRGYGHNIIQVFAKLKSTKFKDIFQPAKEQFNGHGSYGNGGAMRIAPCALAFFHNYNAMIETATKSTELTHTHSLGVNGAILQCCAIWQALQHNPSTQVINEETFCNELISKIVQLEHDPEEDADNTPYHHKLKLVQTFLKRSTNSGDFDDEIITMLGNSVSAYDSVPTAIFCFLRALNNIPQICSDNVFRRTIQYAVSLGGDTDTIASMAGAIAGAYLGEESIHVNMLKQCESNEEIVSLADSLYDISKGYS